MHTILLNDNENVDYRSCQLDIIWKMIKIPEGTHNYRNRRKSSGL